MKPTQLPLFASKPADRAATLPNRPAAHGAGYVLAERIARLLREPVDVHLTDNAWTMVSFKRLHGRVRYRLHHMFSAANDDVLRALAGFTGRNRRAHGREFRAREKRFPGYERARAWEKQNLHLLLRHRS